MNISDSTLSINDIILEYPYIDTLKNHIIEDLYNNIDIPFNESQKNIQNEFSKIKLEVNTEHLESELELELKRVLYKEQYVNKNDIKVKEI